MYFTGHPGMREKAAKDQESLWLGPVETDVLRARSGAP
jgi:hypothetical protein